MNPDARAKNGNFQADLKKTIAAKRTHNAFVRHHASTRVGRSGHSHEGLCSPVLAFRPLLGASLCEDALDNSGRTTSGGCQS